MSVVSDYAIMLLETGLSTLFMSFIAVSVAFIVLVVVGIYVYAFFPR